MMSGTGQVVYSASMKKQGQDVKLVEPVFKQVGPQVVLQEVEVDLIDVPLERVGRDQNRKEIPPLRDETVHGSGLKTTGQGHEEVENTLVDADPTLTDGHIEFKSNDHGSTESPLASACDNEDNSESIFDRT